MEKSQHETGTIIVLVAVLAALIAFSSFVIIVSPSGGIFQDASAQKKDRKCVVDEDPIYGSKIRC